MTAVIRDRGDRRRVSETARAAIATVAPDELELFPLAAEAFFASGRRLPARRRIDDRLGAGVDLGDTLITYGPIALMIANEAVKALIGEGTKTFVKAAGRRLSAWWQRRKAAPNSVDVTEHDVLRTQLIVLATKKGLRQPDAERLVDAVLEHQDKEGHEDA